MSAADLRQKYTRAFVGMEKHSRFEAWAIVAAYTILVLQSIVVGMILLRGPQNVWTIAAMAFLIFFIGTRLRGLNNIVHECSHATFSAHRADNARIGSLCASLTLGCFSDYRDEHLTHHMHLGDYERDLDLKAIKDLRLDERLSGRVLLRHALTPFLGRHLPYYLRINLSAKDGRGFQLLKFGILLAAGLFTLAFPLAGLLFVLVPFVVVYSAMNYWTDCLDHAGLVTAGDDLDAARNVLAPNWIRYLLFPRNDCYHLVHHLFPHVPARHLGTSHAVLLADQAYKTRPNAARHHLSLSALIPAMRRSDAI